MKICIACGQSFETRYEWAHHGCEVAGVRRETNRAAHPPLPLTAAITPGSSALAHQLATPKR